MIAIIDYGLGNIRALENVYTHLGFPVFKARNKEDLIKASKLILPGVGAFDSAIERFENTGMKDVISKMVLEQSIPILGICVGMQMLANCSEEGKRPGLGWIDAKVVKFDSSDNTSIPIPHMGWNNIKPVLKSKLLEGLDENSRFYFLHSYYFKYNNIKNLIALTDYKGDFASIVSSQNIYGVQFHPEKSHEWGIKLLENFAKL